MAVENVYPNGVYAVGLPLFAAAALHFVACAVATYNGKPPPFARIKDAYDEDDDDDNGKKKGGRRWPRVYPHLLAICSILFIGTVLVAWADSLSFNIVNVNGVTEPIVPMFYVVAAFTLPFMMHSILMGSIKNCRAFNPGVRHFGLTSIAATSTGAAFCVYLMLAAMEFYMYGTPRKWWLWVPAIVLASGAFIVHGLVIHSCRSAASGVAGWYHYVAISVNAGAMISMVAICMCGPAGNALVTYDWYRFAQIFILGSQAWMLAVLAAIDSVGAFGKGSGMPAVLDAKAVTVGGSYDE